MKTQYSKSTIADAARFKRPVPITTPSLGNITGAQEEQLFTKSNIYSKDHTVEKNVFYGDEISNFPLPVEPGSEFESNFNNVDNIENVVSEPDVIVSENIDSVPEIGEYRVYVGNENIFSTKNLSTLELFIFKAVKEYNVNVNDLVIIKRLDIKIGAFIEE